MGEVSKNMKCMYNRVSHLELMLSISFWYTYLSKTPVQTGLHIMSNPYGRPCTQGGYKYVVHTYNSQGFFLILDVFKYIYRIKILSIILCTYLINKHARLFFQIFFSTLLTIFHVSNEKNQLSSFINLNNINKQDNSNLLVY